MLEATDQYVFISSARVYAQTEDLITEDTPRLLDVCTDKEYLKTNEYALAKAHITSPRSLLWSEVLEIYLMVLEEHLGNRPNVVMTEKSTNLKFKERIYQVIYCRYFNRTFDNSKIANFCDPNDFKQPQDGLGDCLRQFLATPKFGSIDWVLEAVNDRAAGERTPLAEIDTTGNKLYYIVYRYNLIFLLLPIRAVGRVRRLLLSLVRKMKVK